MADVNILQNGQLDRGFRPFRGNEGLVLPVSWAPWWLSRIEAIDPEWKNEAPAYSPVMGKGLTSGRVCMLETPFAAHTAGLFQQVPAVSGEQYDLSASGMAISSESEDAGKIKNPADVNIQIGIDPTGGTDGESPVIQWGKVHNPVNRWQTMRLSVTAQANIITVFLRSAPSLPKRQQQVYWKDAVLLPHGRYRRSTNIVGPSDTHITIEPDQPEPNQEVTVRVSSQSPQDFTALRVLDSENEPITSPLIDKGQEDDRYYWNFQFASGEKGLHDIRFIADNGARLLAQRLVRITREVQIATSGEPRLDFTRTYVLLPPTADEDWAAAAGRGSFEGRFTVGFSADDAGVGDVSTRIVIAVNPHHWPDTLTGAWYQQHYPGTKFVPVVANTPADLESWLRDWIYE